MTRSLARRIPGVKTLVILIALLGACAHTAPSLEPGAVPAREDIVVSGEMAGGVSGGGDLRLTAASGRVYAVRSPGSRFRVAIPAGVYDVTSIAGVRPAVPLTFNAIPGDRIDLGRFDGARGTVTTRPVSSAGTRNAAYFGSTTSETPLHYYARTGSVVRPLPVPANWGGGSRAGMGLGLRSR